LWFSAALALAACKKELSPASEGSAKPGATAPPAASPSAFGTLVIGG
jgi:hypothetical protein